MSGWDREQDQGQDQCEQYRTATEKQLSCPGLVDMCGSRKGSQVAVRQGWHLN